MPYPLSSAPPDSSELSWTPLALLGGLGASCLKVIRRKQWGRVGKPQRAASSSEMASPHCLPAPAEGTKGPVAAQSQAAGGEPAWAAAEMATGLVAGMAGNWRLSSFISQQ